MTEFADQDLTGARFERIKLNHTFSTRVNLTGAEVRGALIQDARLIGLEMVNVEITGEIIDVTINGVDVGPLIDAELNRRWPLRAKMRPDDADGFREAWAILLELWAQTIERARSLPPDTLHESVGGEWSFVQTLRHLNFAIGAWICRTVAGDPSPWHPLDLPWDQAPGWDGIPWVRDARPALDEVLAVRAERVEEVSRVLDALTDERLTTNVGCTAPGWPQFDAIPLRECLLVILIEHWEHRLYAERDLDALTE